MTELNKKIRDNDYARAAFNRLAEAIHGLNFENWYQNGYWNKKYIPYTMFDGDKAVSNVSVNIMDFEMNGGIKHYIQLGTVMESADGFDEEQIQEDNTTLFMKGGIISDLRHENMMFPELSHA